MSSRFPLLLASAASLMLAVPTLARDEPRPVIEHREVLESSGNHDGEWQGHWREGNSWRGTWNGTYTTHDGEVLDGEYDGTFVGEGRFVGDDGHVLALGNDGWREPDGDYEVHIERNHMDIAASPGGMLGYSLAEREAWLSDCRLLMSNQGGYARNSDRDDNLDGGLLGGLLGALVGGFAGNRIDDDGSRLAGTLIGAGVGGVAGAVIGSAIDGADGDHRGAYEFDANELWAARYCDAYLRRYEMEGGVGFANQSSYGQPANWVPTKSADHGHRRHRHRHGSECTTTVREEWVELERPAPTPRPARRVIPRPQPSGKTVPVE